MAKKALGAAGAAPGKVISIPAKVVSTANSGNPSANVSAAPKGGTTALRNSVPRPGPTATAPKLK